MQTTELKVSGMTCGGCAAHVKKALSALPGVRSVDIELESGRAMIQHEGADPAQMIAALKEEGYEAQAL